MKLRSSISRRSPKLLETFLNSITASPRRSPGGMKISLVSLRSGSRPIAVPRSAPGAPCPCCGRPWRCCAPTRVPCAIAFCRAFSWRLFLLQALVLLHQPVGVVALPRNAVAAVEFEDPLGGVVEEVAVMGDRDHGAGVAGEELLQPLDRLGVEVVGRFVEQQHVRLLQQQPAQRDAALLAAGQLADHRVPRRQAQRVGGDFELVLERVRVAAWRGSPPGAAARRRACRNRRLPRHRRHRPRRARPAR